MEYCFALACEGGNLVAKILGTDVMDNLDGMLTRQCSMFNVRLPLQVATRRDWNHRDSKQRLLSVECEPQAHVECRNGLENYPSHVG